MGQLIKVIGLGLASSFLCLTISCSTMDQILDWRDSSTSKEKNMSHFFSIIRSQPGNPDSHYLLACYYQERGRHKEAIEEFNKVLMIDPGYVKAYNGMGVSYDLQGEFSKAIEYYKLALGIDSNMDYVHNNLGYSYLLQGRFNEAITSFKKAIDLNDQNAMFHNNLGLAYGEIGDYELALVEFKQANDEAKAHHNMAHLYFKKGLFGEAKNHYSIAFKLNPSLTVVHTAMKAADSLASIFEPISDQVEPDQLVIPDQPSTRGAEAGKLGPQDHLTMVKLKMEENIVTEPTSGERTKGEEFVTSKQIALKEKELEELAASVRSTRAKATEVPPSRYYEFPEELAIDEKQSVKKEFHSLKDVEVEISNGNGIYRMARGVKDYLKEKGLKVTRLTNANHFRHKETRILYQKEYQETADYAAEQLPVVGNKEQKVKFDRPAIKVKILIGKDLIPHLHTFKNGAKS